MKDELETFEPSYLRLLRSGELARRVEALEKLLERCTVCPRDCFNDRLNDEIAACYSGRLPIVSSYIAHFGVEPPLVGTGRACNVVFANSKVRSYASVSRAAITEMFRQTGDELVYDKDGLLKRGLVIRLLVLPNDIGGLRESLRWIHDELSPRVAVSLMAQYYPTNVASTNQRYLLLSRRIRETEWLRAVAALDELGMEAGWMQEYDGAAFYYRPDFTDGQTPFRDVRDFQS